MKHSLARFVVPLTLVFPCTLLVFFEPCFSQDANLPALTPLPSEKTYSQIIRELQDLLNSPSNKQEGISYSAVLDIRGGLVISKFNKGTLSLRYSPITKESLRGAYTADTSWADEKGVMHQETGVFIALKAPLPLIQSDGTEAVLITDSTQILSFSTSKEALATVDVLRTLGECTTPDIDWAFLENREGKRLDGYVPKRNGLPQGKSGVTIGTGVDLGQHSPNEINNWAISEELKARLLPYAYPLQGLEADLVANQLHISNEESEQLNTVIRQKKTQRLMKLYDNATHGAKFVELPQQAQTVIFSVAYQFGTISVVSPRLWDDVLRQQWAAAAVDLRDFNGTGQPSPYQKRRELEAKLLDQLVEITVSP